MSHVDDRVTDGVEALPPRTRTATAWIGLVLAVLLVALGLVLAHDALVRLDVLGGRDWITSAADAAGTVTPGPGVAVVGGLVALLGLLLLVGALRPRRRRGAPVSDGNGQYLLPVDVARLASAAARRVDGVLDASTTATAGTVTVTARTTGSGATAAAVQDAVRDALAVLERTPRVRVRARAGDERES